MTVLCVMEEIMAKKREIAMGMLVGMFEILSLAVRKGLMKRLLLLHRPLKTKSS